MQFICNLNATPNLLPEHLISSGNASLQIFALPLSTPTILHSYEETYYKWTHCINKNILDQSFKQETRSNVEK